MSPSNSTPNPGSAEAREHGCICPRIDNNHGKWAPWPPDGWWVVQGCPVHAPPVDSGDANRPRAGATAGATAEPNGGST